MKNIILCGFMGSGKTTIGKLLANKNSVEFIDTDAYIEKREGRSITNIFENDGESYFRCLENSLCKELSKKDNLVISVGGGTLQNDENVSFLKKNGYIFLLDVSADIIYERIKDDTSRPLLQKADKKSALTELYERRLPVYKSVSDFIIDADCTPAEAVERIIFITKSLTF